MPKYVQSVIRVEGEDLSDDEAIAAAVFAMDGQWADVRLKDGRPVRVTVVVHEAIDDDDITDEEDDEDA